MNELALNRWDPFRELEDMHRHLTSLFNGNARRSRDGKESMTMAEWSPAVDITEDDKSYIIKAELPEVKKEDVHVHVENGMLSITGERKAEKEEKGKRYHRIERAYGSFSRSFMLPGDIDEGRVSAAYKDGILTVTVSKSEKAQPKRLEVKVA
jgi:HSP20 family protein